MGMRIVVTKKIVNKKHENIWIEGRLKSCLIEASKMEFLDIRKEMSCHLGKVHVAVYASGDYNYVSIQGRSPVSLHTPVWTWEIHKKS